MSVQFDCQKLFFSSYSVLIQFSISTDFVYTQLNVKTVLCQTIQFSVNTVVNVKVLFEIIHSISTQFKYGLSKTFLFQAIQFNQTIQFSISMPLVLFNP